MQEAVLKIQKLGVPPEGFEDGGCPEDDGAHRYQTLRMEDVTIRDEYPWLKKQLQDMMEQEENKE